MSRCTMPKLWMYLSPKETCRRRSLSLASWKWLPDLAFSDITACKLPPGRELWQTNRHMKKTDVSLTGGNDIENDHERFDQSQFLVNIKLPTMEQRCQDFRTLKEENEILVSQYVARYIICSSLCQI